VDSTVQFRCIGANLDTDLIVCIWVDSIILSEESSLALWYCSQFSRVESLVTMPTCAVYQLGALDLYEHSRLRARLDFEAGQASGGYPTWLMPPRPGRLTMLYTVKVNVGLVSPA